MNRSPARVNNDIVMMVGSWQSWWWLCIPEPRPGRQVDWPILTTRTAASGLQTQQTLYLPHSPAQAQLSPVSRPAHSTWDLSLPGDPGWTRSRDESQRAQQQISSLQCWQSRDQTRPKWRSRAGSTNKEVRGSNSRENDGSSCLNTASSTIKVGGVFKVNSLNTVAWPSGAYKKL